MQVFGRLSRRFGAVEVAPGGSRRHVIMQTGRDLAVEAGPE